MSIPQESNCTPRELNRRYFLNFSKFPVSAEIQFSEYAIQKVIEWGEKLYEEKMNEDEWKRDGLRAAKRIASGKLAELAVGRFIGKNFTDWDIGKTSRFAVSDLKPLKIKAGVKASTFGNVPLIYPKERQPQVIVTMRNNLYDYEFGDLAVIHGVAPVTNILTFIQREYVLSSGASEKGKLGYVGHEGVLLFKNFEELKTLCRKN